MKIESGYVNILDRNKIYNIIESKVKYIETEILPKK